MSQFVRRFSSVSRAAAIRVGDAFPSVSVQEGSPKTVVNLKDAFAGKKVVLVTVPGAYTSVCSTQLPQYVKKYSAIAGKGVDTVAFVAANDVFVVDAWAKHNSTGPIRMFADPTGAGAKALDLELNAPAVFGSLRYKRSAMLVENGKVTKLNVEPDGTGLTCSSIDSFISQL